MSAKDMFYPEDHQSSKAEDRAFARQDLIYNVTEDILIAMEDLDVSKKELARRLSKSASYVTQILSGARNMTIGSLSDICFALDIEPSIGINVDTGVVEDNISDEVKGDDRLEYASNEWVISSDEKKKSQLGAVYEITEHPRWGKVA